MQSKLFFYGGAGSVTGANFLLDTGKNKLLIDCGLQQGLHEEANWQPFAYNPAEVSHLVVTHAHIDHIGRIPWLVKQGFRGSIISTKATKDLSEPLLLDAVEIMAHRAKRFNEKPLYDAGDIARAMALWRGVSYHETFELQDDVTGELFDAGHILGSAMVKLSRDGRSMVFTGDLGSGNSPLLAPVEGIGKVDYLLMESVYGDRTRPEDIQRREQLEDVIENSAARGGMLLIPAFSTERTQDLLFEIRNLMVEKRVPHMPVYLDSPLAEKITKSYLANPEYFSPAIRTRVEKGEDVFAFPELHYVSDVEESHTLAHKPGPKIILAGSGMGQGGRVIAHEEALLPDPHNTVLLVGYQALGTTGRQLWEGDKSIKIYGKPVKVEAHIEAIFGYSAHMDGQALLEFANRAAAGGSIKEIFVCMGEPASAAFLAQRIRDYLGTKATTPNAGESVVIEL